MGKRARQYIGLVVAVALYYTIHEGAHLMVALAQGVFKQINIIGLGMQIDVYAEQMSDNQMAIFCLAGPLATLIAGWVMVLCVKQIPDEKESILKEGEWNTLRLRVEGNKVQTWLNGEAMMELDDELIGSKTGRIMLQIHDGNNIKVLWRNFNLTKL